MVDTNPTPDPAALKRHKLWQTFWTLALVWGGVWTFIYGGLTMKGEGPGDAGSWLGVLAIAWGPTAALAAGRSWLGWYRAPE